ncbi:ABC transporter permease [Oceanobacillus piezotolerans]|uniref:ABC transporter permease n=1 Tax=Oceanobacillus piezotolerans TaxID=2448030 RepID=A0A498D367_9BACI|nr:ABC transporter permease subunit [Oceanobacillus piezotolerans]RLL40353.1 ABC transporter permease [Oceanobacillus piezotolerans]
MQWMTLLKKELIENWRNRKFIWVPLVFILLAIMEPLSTYYMPEILDAVGGLPEGTVLDMPELPPGDVLMLSLAQFSSLGVLLIVLLSMGTIAGERKSGVAELILVKPVSYTNYITAKWLALFILVFIAFLLGLAGGFYYTTILFGELPMSAFFYTLLFYSLWLAFVVTISIFYNTIFNSPGLVAFASIATIILMSVITQVFGHVLDWSPNQISAYLSQMMVEETVSKDLIATGLTTAGMTIILLVLSVIMFKRKELAN